MTGKLLLVVNPRKCGGFFVKVIHILLAHFFRCFSAMAISLRDIFSRGTFLWVFHTPTFCRFTETFHISGVVELEKMNGTAVLGVILAFLGLKAYGKVSAVSGLAFSLGGLPGFSSSAGRAVLRFPVDISNTSTEKFAVSWLKGKVFVNDAYLGDVEHSDPFTIIAGGVTRVAFELFFKLGDAFTALLQALGKKGVVIRIAGTVAAYGLQLPFDVTRTF